MSWSDYAPSFVALLGIPFRRLLTRREHQDTNYLGFVQLAAVLIIYRKVRHARSLP